MSAYQLFNIRLGTGWRFIAARPSSPVADFYSVTLVWRL